MARTKEFDKEQVLKKAMDLFWAKGYNATSMQDLVDGLGISRSSMYDTFGDKEALFCAALSSYKTHQSASICDAFTNIPSPLQAIKAIFGGILTGIVNDDAKGCFLVNAATELSTNNEKVKGLICQNTDEVVNTLTIGITKGQKLGEIKKNIEATQLAHYIYNTMTGIQVSLRAGTDKKNLTDVVAITIASLQA